MFLSDLKSNLNSLNTRSKFLLIIIFLIPISLLSGPATLEPLLLILSIVCLTLIYNKEIKIEFNLFTVLILILYLLAILSSSLSDYQTFSLKSSMPTMRFFLYVIIISHVLKQNSWIIYYYFIFLMSLLLFLLLDGLLQKFTGYNLFLIPDNETIITSFFGDEKKLGRYLVVILSVTSGLFLALVKKKKYLIYFLLLIFIFNFFLIVTSERVSLFNSLIVTLIFIVLIAREISNKILFLLLIPFIVFSIFFKFSIDSFDQTLKNTFKQITGDGSKVYFFSQQHENFAYTAFEIFKNKPIIGIGPKNFRNECKKIIPKYKFVSNCSTHPHNNFFQILSELGILGVIIHILFFYKLLEIVIKNLVRKTDLRQSALIFFILPALFYLNPLLPSGNIFNNWNMMMGIFQLPFYFYFKKKNAISKK